jgi:hypothetical protein
MLPTFRHAGFHLEINSLDEFALFCALIRGKDLDVEAVRAQLARLQTENAALETRLPTDPPVPA